MTSTTLVVVCNNGVGNPIQIGCLNNDSTYMGHGAGTQISANKIGPGAGGHINNRGTGAGGFNCGYGSGAMNCRNWKANHVGGGSSGRFARGKYFFCKFPDSYDEERFEKIFRGYGTVSSIRIPNRNDKYGNRFGFVTFSKVLDKEGLEKLDKSSEFRVNQARPRRSTIRNRKKTEGNIRVGNSSSSKAVDARKSFADSFSGRIWVPKIVESESRKKEHELGSENVVSSTNTLNAAAIPFWPTTTLNAEAKPFRPANRSFPLICNGKEVSDKESGVVSGLEGELSDGNLGKGDEKERREEEIFTRNRISEFNGNTECNIQTAQQTCSLGSKQDACWVGDGEIGSSDKGSQENVKSELQKNHPGESGSQNCGSDTSRTIGNGDKDGGASRDLMVEGDVNATQLQICERSLRVSKGKFSYKKAGQKCSKCKWMYIKLLREIQKLHNLVGTSCANQKS